MISEIIAFILMGLIIIFLIIKCENNSRRIQTLERNISKEKCNIHVGSFIEDLEKNIEEVTL